MSWLEELTHPQSVPDEIVNTVRARLASGDAAPSIADIKRALRDSKLCKYYEQAATIRCFITGEHPFVVPPELEPRVIQMFESVIEAFERVRPADRPSFLPYRYVLFRLCEMLGETPPREWLLRGEKLVRNDAMWKLICDELQWPCYTRDLSTD